MLGPVIILGTNKSAVRRNFDLAHELGHLLLHKSQDKDEDLESLEREANYFASCFLLPKAEFLEDFEKMVGSRISNPDSYASLKANRQVSIQALEYRAFKLGLLTPQQHAYLYRQIAKKGYKIVEPLDMEILVKKPSKVRSILDVIFSHNLISLPALLTQQKVRKQFISDLFAFDVSFFDKYQDKQSVESFANIIPLNRKHIR